MCLIELKEGQMGIIESINAGKPATKRLVDLGVTCGKEVKVINNLFSGPIQIEVSGSALVLGHGVASKITVITVK